MNHSSKKWLRSIGAIVAGFFVTAILSVATDAVLHLVGVLPKVGEPMSDELFLLPATYRIIFTVVGGYVAARLAPDRPISHAWVLACLGTFIGALTVVAYLRDPQALGPLWYALSIPLSAIPAILAGAYIALGRKKRLAGPQA